jgi:hypothetical protein
MKSILAPIWNTSPDTKKQDTKEIQNSSAEEEPCGQKSDEGAVDKCVSWPDLVWVFAATALFCSANQDFLPILIGARLSVTTPLL